MDGAPTNGLTEQEHQLLYNCEVLKMTQQRAAELAGYASFPSGIMKKPEMLAAREKMRQYVRERAKITREDIVAGLQEAVEMSRIVSDPMAMIAAWRETAKILGLDKPQEVHLVITGDVKELRRQVRALPERELLRLADENNIIDADFYDLGSADV